MKTGIVIGNGLVGACTALAMQRVGLQVTMVDPGDDKAGASHGNAGHLAVEQTEPLASRANVLSLHRRLFSRGGPVAFPLRDVSAWLPFGLKLLAATAPQRFERGRAAMQALLEQAIPAWQRVAAHIHADDLIRTDGHWITWESETRAQSSFAGWQAARTGVAKIAMASATELAALRAQFNHLPVAAARFTGTGQVTDLLALRRALKAAFVAAGGEIKTGVVRDVGERVTLAGGASLGADVTVVTAGIGASQVLKNAYRTIPLIAERGYHIEIGMDASQATPAGLPVVFEDRSTILAPFRTSLRLSSFTEFSHASSPPDERKWEALQQHAIALGLPMGLHPQRWMGARPTLPDYLPAMGQHPRVPSLFYAFGHNHLGVTLAALTGELMCSAIQGTAPSVDLSPFSLQRFQ
jgi:glycine/D-amino acid oxidase-like deaminating enzyme